MFILSYDGTVIQQNITFFNALNIIVEKVDDIISFNLTSWVVPWNIFTVT
jgi:hypothetical protein